MNHFEAARHLLREFKGEAYVFGNHVLGDVGGTIASCGRRAVLVRPGFAGAEDYVGVIRDSVARAGVDLVAEVRGARPNAPREDLLPMVETFRRSEPDVIISSGGGSIIDATKAATVLWTLGGEIDDYFGTGLVGEKLERDGAKLISHAAIQTAASSGAHLTKYANITDLSTGQKKLIVDEAIVPARPIFDYTVTHQAPPELTADGALDGMAHILEVFYGAVGKPHYEKLCSIAQTGISLIVNYLPQVLQNPHNVEAREALCLATDLGGYAIMLGGTNGGHLTSFSLVDVLTHGRACALMNPYYTVFFAPAVEGPLRVIGGVFHRAGFLSQDPEALSGRELGTAVAEGMFAFARAIGFPTTLNEVQDFTDAHIERALTAAKNPQLQMKLENMPIPLTAEMIDEYMGPILEAARTGDVTIVKNV